jgi:lipopolysaccharide exporter
MAEGNYWIRSGAYAIIQRVVAFLFGFGSYFLLVRYFSVDDFGVWTLYVVVSGAAEMSRSAFIQNAFVKFFNQEGFSKAALFTSSLFLNFIATLIIVLALFILIPVMQYYWNSSIIGVLILWYCLTSVILIPFTQFNYLEQANHRFVGVFWSSFTRQGSFFVVVIITYFYFPHLPLAFFAAAQLIAAVLGLLVSFAMTRKFLPSSFPWDWIIIKKLFVFGKYILGTGLTSTVGKNADQVILGGVSHGMVALYNSCIRVLNFIEIPSLSVSNVTYPKIAAQAGSAGPEGVGILYEKSVGGILSLILPIIIVVALFPEWILSITAGAEYVHAFGALRTMALASILLPFNIQIGSVCEVLNKPHASFYINLISNILNLALNIVLIRLFGTMGAAWALAGTLVFIFIVGQYYVAKQWGIFGLRAFGRVFGFYEKGIRLALNRLSTGK